MQCVLNYLNEKSGDMSCLKQEDVIAHFFLGLHVLLFESLPRFTLTALLLPSWTTFIAAIC
jgi:hypothetical protein